MAEPAPYLPSGRRGRAAFWALVVLVVVGVVAVLRLWPESVKERRDAAVDLCKAEVDTVEPTQWPKQWQESSFRIDGDEVVAVSGEFATKDTGFRRFSCEVEDGEVTSSQVGPGRWATRSTVVSWGPIRCESPFVPPVRAGMITPEMGASCG